jgi:serine-type D-Ala-D-Ala carboxypeptidase/endopeptidase (penicillin-binding protein 4)
MILLVVPILKAKIGYFYMCQRQILLPCIMLFQFAFTQSLALCAAQNSPLQKIMNWKKDSLERSVSIVRLKDGKVLFENNGDNLLIPASVTKLVTSAAILSKFGPPHTFATKFYYSGKRNQSVIDGDLIIKGDGDPFLVSEHLWQVAADIKHKGIVRFKGNIVIDNSLFDSVARDASRKFGQRASRNAYDAPVSAFGINFNTYAISVAPNAVKGNKALVGIDPYPLKDIDIVNSIKTTTGSGRPKVQISRIASKGIDRLVAKGTIPANSLLVKKYRSVSDHLKTSGEYVRAFLFAQGIIVDGQVKSAGVPSNAKLFMVLGGYQMRRIVQGLNTYSNNYIADVMVKRLGAAFPAIGKANSVGQGTYKNGLHAINMFLKSEVGIKSKYVLENGSGLSPDNRMSSNQIISLLRYMERDMKVFPEYLASLPASGWDGTMKKRFREHSKYHGVVRAKTGTLTVPVAAVGLAGYLRHPKHGLVAFSILENGKKGRRKISVVDIREHQDHFLTTFLKE